jgi:methionyl-tRNA synthetase
VNAEPHIGFAAEITRADAIARWHRLNGEEVFFNTGTDEHGLKIYKKALEAGKNPQEYCDYYAGKFNDLKAALNLSYNNFIRTTDEHHIKAAQEFWRRCQKNGDIYKKNYKTKYCVGCEAEKTESELVAGKCPVHPNLEPEVIEEENYFFRFSRYQEKLLKLYKDNPEFVLPDWRLNEIAKFAEGGLEDFSISRLKNKMPWGVPVPDDDEQVMYVWFDALTNYISAIGFPEEKFLEWWPGMQVCGKDNLRFQAAMWQAMLMSAGIVSSKQILVFGFITANGQKISKSSGNTVDPLALVQKYGTDAVRYHILSEFNTFTDSDYSEEKFNRKFNADLANGLGNLVARAAALLEKNEIEIGIKMGSDEKLKSAVKISIESYNFSETLQILWQKLRVNDEILSARKPWELKDKAEIKKILEPVAQDILNVAELLSPFMPETAEKIIRQFSERRAKKSEPLFPRLS